MKIKGKYIRQSYSSCDQTLWGQEMVRQQNEHKDITYENLLEHAKQHECTVKDFNWHRVTGRVAIAATIGEIKTFKSRYNNSYKGRGSSGKACSECAQSQPHGECPAWGKKCHKCGNKNHFSTYCRSKPKGQGDGKRGTHGRSRSKRQWGNGGHCRSRSGSKPRMRSTHSIELESFQDNDQELHGRHPEEELHCELPADTDLHER